MSTETRTSAEIERDIEHDRARLTDNLESLQAQFSIDNAVRQVGDQLRLHGGDIGRSISVAAKDNPMALALTGVGIAWLIFGSGRQSGDNHDGRDRSYARPLSGMTDEPPASTYRAGSAQSSYRRPRRFDETPSWARAADPFDGDHRHGDERVAGSDDDTSMPARAREAGGVVSDRVSAAGANVRDTARSAGEALSDGAARARSAIGHGTETLSEEARAKVVAAREAALSARRSAMNSLEAASEAGGDFYERQPFVAGALALAVGAAIGGALPRTRSEDDLVGAQSDHLMAEAERIFSEEYEKARKVLDAVVEEASDMTAEAKAELDASAPEGQTAAEASVDRVEGAVDRLAGVARESAEREGLGKPTL